MKKKITNSFLLIAYLYFGTVAYLYIFQVGLIYTIIPLKISPAQLEGAEKAQVISVTTEDGIKLEGWYFPPKTPENPKVFVHFHGNGQYIGSSFGGVKKFLPRGYGLLMAEYREYSGNAGTFNEQGAYTDGRAFVDWLHRKKTIPYKDMILYGESLGSAVAVQMATEIDAHALVLYAPFSSMLDIIRGLYWFAPVDLILQERFMNTEKMQNVSEPLLLLHGTNDAIVPIHYAQKLYESAKEPKKFIVIENGAHNNLYDFGIADHILEFLDSTKTNQPTTPE